MVSPPSDPRQRLLELARARGASLSALSELLGKNPSYLQQFIRKGSPRKLDEVDRRTLAEFFGVPDAELGGAQEISGARPNARDAEWVEVPRLPLGASAGPGAVAAQEVPFDSFRFSRRWLRENGLESAQLSSIAVAGDSMEPLLRDGDEILVDRTQRPLRDGVHVLRVGDVLMVKRVAQGGAGRITLLSANPAYPPLEVSLEEVEIVGRVVWKGGRL
ncbi:MAG: LexA family transcriptional regulator [Tsuneonella sp.]